MKNCQGQELSDTLNCNPYVLEKGFFKGKQLVLYGAGRLGDMAVDIMADGGVFPEFFVDINAQKKPTLRGFSVYPPEQLRDLDPESQIVLVCVFKFPFGQIKRQIRQYTQAPVYSIYDLFWFMQGAFFTNGWQSGELSVEDYANIEKVYDNLSDEQSKKTYLTFLAWRIARNENVDMVRDIIHEENKYVNSLTLPAMSRKGIIFDAGAFDLSFSLDVIKRRLPATTIVAFEPDHLNYAACQKTLASGLHAPQIAISSSAVSDRTDLLPFVHGHGLASRLGDGNNNACHPVVTCTLDDYYEDLRTTEPIVAIKLHVEGHELEALKGARKIIAKHRPLLLINCSHNRDGLWKIPSFCMQYDRYQFYMRQHAYYGEGLTYYAVPI